MRARLLIIFGLLIFSLTFTGCAGNSTIQPDKSGQTGPDHKIIVLTTIYPLYDFTRNVGKDRVEVNNLTPPGAEPHEWEPSPKDLAGLQKADVFIYCGAGMENWTGKALNAAGTPGLTVIDASRDIELISGQENTHNAVTDPHIWVDPLNAIKMVDNITSGLVRADPANREFYEINAAEYKKKIEALHEEYKNGLALVKQREFVTSHAAFGYLARRYGLVQAPVRGLSPEVEPTPARMAEVIRLVKEKNIRYIFFESLVSPKISQVIASESGAGTLVLDPVAGLTPDDLQAGKDYLSVMRENLANLQKALEVSQ